MSGIKAGDLVVVVKPGCTDVYVGLVFRVGHIKHSVGVCGHCGTNHGYPDTLIAFPGLSSRGFEFPRLKRIPPLSELEGQRTQEDMKEPA